MSTNAINITINVAGDLIWNWYGVPSPVYPYTVVITQIGAARMPDAKKSSQMPKQPKHHSKPKPGGNSVAPGGTGTFQAQLLNNNVPIDLPAGSSWGWSVDDPTVSFAPDSTDPTGGTVIVAVPADSTIQQFTISVDTTDPNGNALSQSLAVPVTPGVSIYSISLTQIA